MPFGKSDDLAGWGMAEQYAGVPTNVSSVLAHLGGSELKSGSSTHPQCPIVMKTSFAAQYGTAGPSSECKRTTLAVEPDFFDSSYCFKIS